MRLPSLRARIFIALIFLVMVASLLIAGVTIVQYSEQSNTYHEQRLERKENQLKKRLKYLLESTPFDVEAANIAAVFQPHLKETADVLNINFRLYSLSGDLLCSSQLMESIPSQTLSELLQRCKLRDRLLLRVCLKCLKRLSFRLFYKAQSFLIFPHRWQLYHIHFHQ